MRKIIKITIISILSIIVMAFAYSYLRWSDYVTSGELEVKDISKDTLFLAVNNSIASGAVCTSSLHIQGEVDDSIKIDNYYIIPKGKVDYHIFNEYYYKDSIYVHYKANNAKKGHLKIKYKFDVY